jgi:uncharacterized delta-60 repeat protein
VKPYRAIILAGALALATIGPQRGWAQSSEDMFDPDVLGEYVNVILVQPDGRILVGGNYTNMAKVTCRSFGRLLVNGTNDAGFTCRVAGDVLDLVLTPSSNILVGGFFTNVNDATRSNLAWIDNSGALGAAPPAPDNRVWVLARQVDGQILVGGDFTAMGGAPCSYLARLASETTLDANFPTALFNATVYALAVQPDRKILVAGNFTAVGGDTNLCRIARLNPDGSVDPTFNPIGGANAVVFKIAVQPDGKILLAGNFTQVTGLARNGLARLNADGTLDTSFTASAELPAQVNSLLLQPDGKIAIAGTFQEVNGSVRRYVARLNPDGSLDTFYPSGGPNDVTYALALQQDGKVLVGGEFLTVSGYDRKRLVRLYPSNGDVESTFKAGEPDTAVFALASQTDSQVICGGDFTVFDGAAHMGLARATASRGFDDPAFTPSANRRVNAAVIQPDGKILVAGRFTVINGPARNRIARLNADGSLDTGFDPNAINDEVFGITLLRDGALIASGCFTNIGGAGVRYLAKLGSNGVVDATFNPDVADFVNGAAVQTDGRVIIYGRFVEIGGQAHRRIARLNADGSLDTTFNPGDSADSDVTCAAIQPDGKIVIGGLFAAVNGVTRHRMARLNADGSLDTAFDPDVDNTAVYSLALQADGKITIGGNFSTVGGVGRSNIARLNADGSLDTSYYPSNGANSTILALALQADGELVVGGGFTAIGNNGRNNLARLSTSNAALQELAVNGLGTRLTWTRSGSSPEIQWSIFQWSSDRSNWTDIGYGARGTGDWECVSGATLPLNTNVYIRALGYAQCGYQNGSGSLLESVRRVFLTPPAVAITSLVGTVTAAVDAVACSLSGTANSNVVGVLQWTNSLTGENGTLATAATWSVTGITLREGTNVFTVSASNIIGTVASDSASLVVPWSKPLAADYDGDRLADPAAYIGTNLYVWPSRFNYAKMGPLPYGVEGALPAAADFDGDRQADPAAYAGVDWYAWMSAAGYARVGPYSYGIAGALPVAADFDGDGIGDVAVYAGTDWTAWLSGSGYIQEGPYSYGMAGATAVAADFDGDGLADPAVYSGTNWTAWLSGSGYAQVGPYSYGFTGAVPIAADFDGDGFGDVAVSHNRQWYAWLSSMGYVQIGPYAFNLQE